MRQSLPNRRRATTQKFRHDGKFDYLVTVGFFNDGRPGEIFVNTEMKSGTEADIAIADAAIAVSLALQYGCPLETIRQALKRNEDNSPQGALAHALDVVSEIVK